MMIDVGSASDRISSSYVTTRSVFVTPGSIFVVEPAAMMQLSNVIDSVPSSVVTDSVWASTNVPQPLTSVMRFFFMRKWTPLIMRCDTARLRLNAEP